MGHPSCAQRLKDAPIAVADPFIYTEASFQIRILDNSSAIIKLRLLLGGEGSLHGREPQRRLW